MPSSSLAAIFSSFLLFSPLTALRAPFFAKKGPKSKRFGDREENGISLFEYQ
ncbi:hypothetical protein GA8_06310 [Geobacillus sp. A8]|nr:hypothetical protein GA8_06310 [Geobacillus sp. A8]